MQRLRSLAIAAAAFAAAAFAAASSPAPAASQSPSAVPDLTDIAAFETSSFASVVTRFSSDLGALERKWAGMPYSDARYERMRDFLEGWADALSSLPVVAGDVDGSIDHVLLSAEVRYRQELLAREERTLAEVAPLLPFGPDILALLEIRHHGRPVDGQEIASSLAALAVAVEGAEEALKAGAAAGGAGLGGDGRPTPTPITGLRAMRVRFSPTAVRSAAGTATTPATTHSSPGGRNSPTRRRTRRSAATCRCCGRRWSAGPREARSRSSATRSEPMEWPPTWPAR